ncbi:hypothetical protein GpartN1_g6274.t1 [Galdieria partita]|uniref:C3H1-type domain-containing protein n=1 Tax=Galdieria partita TaxID=83374 RepID=A0A9C7UT41_9RHOD|nr:hypothetical protein GpartN1_g6274.t1 [Galdieria partita]
MTSFQELEEGELQENSPLPFNFVQQPSHTADKLQAPQRHSASQTKRTRSPPQIENWYGFPLLEDSTGNAQQQQVGFVTDWNPWAIAQQQQQRGTNNTHSVDSFQVIQVISSLIARGFPVPSDWLQNPQIYQWLVEWIQQSTQTPFWTSGSSDQPMRDNSLHPVFTKPSNSPMSIEKGDNERKPYSVAHWNSHSLKSRKKKTRQNLKSTPQNSKYLSKNMIYHRKQQQQQQEGEQDHSRSKTDIIKSNQETTFKESNPNNGVEEDTRIEQQEDLKSPEQNKNQATLEQLRNQAKMALKRKNSVESSCLEKTPDNKDTVKDLNDSIDQSQQGEPQEELSTQRTENIHSNNNTPTTLGMNHSSSLIITLDTSSSSSNTNNNASNQQNKENKNDEQHVSGTSQSKWSTLEELRRRVEELEQRKKQYLQRGVTWKKDKRPKTATDIHIQKGENRADSSIKSQQRQYWQPFTSSQQPSSIMWEAQVTREEQSGSRHNEEEHPIGEQEASCTTRKELVSSSKALDDLDMNETKAWIERLERETCKAWEEHDKSITEEIEARNKLIRIRTCEEAARESIKLLKELLKKSRLDIQQYGSQAYSIEKQIEQIEVRRKRAFAIAEKSQRKFERLRRLVAMESLMDRETEPLLLLFQTIDNHSKEKDRKDIGESHSELWSPSPWTSGALKPLMSTFRCYPLLHSVYDYSELKTWYNDLKLETELCRYDLHGSCSDPDCKFQHSNEYTSVKYILKKLEKSFSTLFWLRHGIVPSEKCLQLLHSRLESLSIENTLHWFQGPVQRVVCELLDYEKNVSSMENIHSTALFIPLKAEENNDSPLHRWNKPSNVFGREEEESSPTVDFIWSQSKLLYHSQQVHQSMETLARGLERFPDSSLLWESYFAWFIPHICTRNMETLLEQANRYCPDRNWHEWVVHRMEQSSQNNHHHSNNNSKSIRYYGDHLSSPQ